MDEQRRLKPRIDVLVFWNASKKKWHVMGKETDADEYKLVDQADSVEIETGNSVLFQDQGRGCIKTFGRVERPYKNSDTVVITGA